MDLIDHVTHIVVGEVIIPKKEIVCTTNSRSNPNTYVLYPNNEKGEE